MPGLPGMFFVGAGHARERYQCRFAGVARSYNVFAGMARSYGGGSFRSTG